MKIILASASPRRRDILRQLGLEFEVRAPRADEKGICGTPRQVVKTLALRKADAVDCGEDEVLIAADTVVSLDGRIMNKPENDEDARRMLSSLSGRCHSVFTGVCVRRGDGGLFTEVCETKVYFRRLEPEEIEEYIKTGEPADKAGAYGIQGRGAILTEKIEGDYSNVVGLPATVLYRLLKKAGVRV